MNKIIRFNKIEMDDFFKNFDYLEVKYNPLIKSLSEDETKDYTEIIPLLKKAFADYELNKHHTIYNKAEYYELYERIKLIYNDEDTATDMVNSYDFALSRLIDRFLDIDSLASLFNHHYFEFEWKQHVDMNFDKNDLSFYRDHFIHQIRNCYMTLELLERKSGGNTLMNKIKKVLKGRGTELAKNACVYVENYKDHIRFVVEHVLRDDDSILNKNILSWKEKLKKVKSTPQQLSTQIMKNAEDFAWEYFIRGSLVVATLFHDLGYPVKFMYENMDILNDYLASIIPQNNISFDRLNDLLNGSLLFTIEDKKVLKQQYDERQHGALSAYILLLHFYESGTIHSLNPIKKAMIEFGALMIFDHTLKWYDKKGSKYKPSFSDNPLSYVLRFVDDMQEWDRTYFEIRHNSDLRYCEKCKMPIGRIWSSKIEERFKEDYVKYLNVDESIYSDDKLYEIGITDKDKYVFDALFPDPMMKRIYYCGCCNEENKKDILNTNVSNYFSGENRHFSSGIFENGSLFPYRKLNYTVVSNSVLCEYEDDTDSVLKDKQNKKKHYDNQTSNEDKPLKLRFYIDYDPFRELYALILNAETLNYRIGELSELNKQFEWQVDVDFHTDAYMTNNPLMLKLRVLLNFLFELGYGVGAIEANFEGYKYYRPNPIYLHKIREYEYSEFYELAKTLKNDLHLFFYDYGDKTAKGGTISPCKIDFSDIVDFLMGKNCNAIFKNNLVNTLGCYFNIVQSAIKNSDITEKEEYISAMRADIHFSPWQNYYDENHKLACDFLLNDMLLQLYHLKEYTNLDEYYKMYDMESKDEYDKNNKKRKPYSEKMNWAVKTVLVDKNYNPYILRSTKVNIGKFDFFDIKSDLYLFKEMYRFSRDNYFRRVDKPVEEF